MIDDVEDAVTGMMSLFALTSIILSRCHPTYGIEAFRQIWNWLNRYDTKAAWSNLSWCSKEGTNLSRRRNHVCYL